MRLAGVTARQLAVTAGWSSHSYATRLLRGEVSTVGAEAAVRIAERLGVGVDDLFASDTTTIPGHTDQAVGS